MPIIQFNLLEGRSIEMKRELAQKVTETVVGVLGVKPETVRILIHEMTMNDFSVGGVTAADRLAANGVVPGMHSKDYNAAVMSNGVKS